MIRILQAVNDMNRAGLETMLMNYYRHMDRTKIQFDFLTHRPYRGDYDDEIEALGGKIYYAPRLYPQNLPAYFRYMKQFFREHPEYQIIHSHIDAMSYLPLLAAKRAGVPVRIAHSHNTSVDKDFKYLLKEYYRFRLPSAANIYYACGEEAGRFLFGDRDVTVVPNAIDAEKFSFNADVRKAMREELDIEDKLVIGHVGRFSYQKNHGKLIEIFSEAEKKNKNALLVLVGVGEKETEIREQVHQLELDEKVKFLGLRSDVSSLYQAMDVFVMPSLFEGIPVVGVEAQFSGLPCIFSDKVPAEVKFNENCRFVPLNASAADWAEQVLSAAVEGRCCKTENQDSWRYDIRYAYKLLEQYYIELFDYLK